MPIVLKNDKGVYKIGKSISYLRDASGTLSLENILSTNVEFTPSTQEQLSFGYTNDAIWIKITLENQSGFNDWILNLDIDNINYIDFYQQQEGQWQKYETGNYLPFSTKEIKRVAFAFSLNLHKEAQKTYYLRVQTETALILPLYIQKTESFTTHILFKTLYYGAFFGILLVMIIYNFFIYLTLRDKNYLFYILTIISTLAIFSTMSGYNFMLFWQNTPSINAFVPRFAITSTIFTTALFCIHFLQLKKDAPKLYFVMILNIILASVSAILHLFTPIKSLNNPLGIYHVIMLIVSGAIIWRKGNLIGKYFVFAWAFYVLGAVMIMLRQNGVLPSNFFTLHAIELGSMLEVVVIAFALSEKYRLLKKEKEQTHQKYLQIEKEANEELEGKVNERTAELQATLDTMSKLYMDIENKNYKIEQKNSNINSSINYASRIQEAFLAIDDKVKKTLPEHFILLKPRDVVSGDFHFFAEKEGKIIIAAVDCTGHGVPGAMMSMIGQVGLPHQNYNIMFIGATRHFLKFHYNLPPKQKHSFNHV